MKGFDPSSLASYDIQYGDIRVIKMEIQQMTVKNGEVTYYIQGNETGAGIRMLNHGTWGFSSTTDISSSGLERALHRAYHAGCSLPGKSNLVGGRPITQGDTWTRLEMPDSQVMRVMKELESVMHCSPLIREGRVGLRLKQGTQTLWNTEGSEIVQDMGQALLDLRAVAKKNGTLSDSSFTWASTDLKSSYTDMLIEKAGTAAREALARLDVHRPPNGEFKVILGSSLASIFIHEAVGHRMEADEVKKPHSIMRDKIGTAITHPSLSVKDAMIEETPWYAFDDEGICKKETVLIEKGSVRGFLHDRQTAHSFHTEPTGNSRASSYETQPLVRMTTIQAAPGDMSREELIEECDTGVFLDGFVGGTAVAGGMFRFAARGGYCIENGKCTIPLGRSTISGSTLQSLAGVEGVGKNTELYYSECIKKGQGVLVGLGSPDLLISQLRVGG